MAIAHGREVGTCGACGKRVAVVDGCVAYHVGRYGVPCVTSGSRVNMNWMVPVNPGCRCVVMAEKVACEYCGRRIAGEADLCPSCGAPAGD